MGARRAMAIAFVAGACIACAPAIESPAQRAAAGDAIDADRIAAVVRAAPYVIDARVALHRAFRDPLTGATTPSAAMAVVVIDSRADRGLVDSVVRGSLRAVVPEVAPHVVVAVGGRRDELARVGPFTVAASAKLPLTILLVALLAAIAALSAFVAWRDRPV